MSAVFHGRRSGGALRGCSCLIGITPAVMAIMGLRGVRPRFKLIPKMAAQFVRADEEG